MHMFINMHMYIHTYVCIFSRIILPFILWIYFLSYLIRDFVPSIIPPLIYQQLLLISWIFTYENSNIFNLKSNQGASLVAQWLRICLPVQGTRVQTLVQEDPTCRGGTKPMRHNYWARVPQLLSPRSATGEATAMRSLHTTTKSSPLSPQLEKSPRTAAKTEHSQK